MRLISLLSHPPPLGRLRHCRHMMPSSSIAKIQSLLGYKFRDQRLLEEALTHGSHPDRPTYQRLEFVGDAALGLAVARFLFLFNPSLGSGELTILRKANVSTEKLARACVLHGLYTFLRRNDRVLDQQVIDFENSVRMESEDESEVSHGGSSHAAPKVLADIIESTAAAVYMDSNYDLDLMWEVFRKILDPIITNKMEHPVTILKELMEKKHKKIEIRESQKNSLHIAEIVVDDGDIVLGNGSGSNKTIATLNAARDALQKLPADPDSEAEDGVASESIAKLNAASDTLQKVSSSQTDDMDVEMCLTNDNEITDEKGSSKKRLHELCCKKHWLKPLYKIEIEEGPEHSKRFVSSVHVETTDCTYVVLGDPKSRVKDAESSAATKLLLDILTDGVVK